MERQSVIENAMRQHVALSPLTMAEKRRRDAEDCEAAIELIRTTRRVSTSHFHQRLGWGYNRAARIIDLLRKRGIVGIRAGMRTCEIIKLPKVASAKRAGVLKRNVRVEKTVGLEV